MWCFFNRGIVWSGWVVRIGGEKENWFFLYSVRVFGGFMGVCFIVVGNGDVFVIIRIGENDGIDYVVVLCIFDF